MQKFSDSMWVLSSARPTRILSLLLVLGLLNPIRSRADDAGTAAPAADVKNESPASTATLAFIAATANHIKNTRSAKVNISWPLASDAGMSADIDRKVKGTVVLTLPNSEIRNFIERPEKKLDSDQLKTLHDALGLKDDQPIASIIKPETHADAGNKYLTALKSHFPSQGLNRFEYTAARNDYYLLRCFAISDGVQYNIQCSTGDPSQKLERTYQKEIVWDIKIFPVTRKIKDVPFTYYRVVLMSHLARPDNYEFQGSMESVKYTGQVGFIQNENTIGLNQFASEATGELAVAAAPMPSGFDDVSAKVASTSLNGTLSFLGGAGLESLVDYQIFGGSARSSLYYGGIVGQGKVKQMVGVNQILKSSASGQTNAGLLFGITPDQSSTLFVGPTLQTGPLTVGVGASIRQLDENGSSNSHVKVRSAFTLAMDMSKLVGGKKDIETIPILNNTIGAPLNSDALAAAVIPVTIKVTLDPAIAALGSNAIQGKYFQLVGTTNDEQPKAITRTIFLSSPVQDVDLPLGTYHIKVDDASFPATWQLWSEGLSLVTDKTNNVLDEKQQDGLTFSYTVKPAPAAATPAQ